MKRIILVIGLAGLFLVITCKGYADDIEAVLDDNAGASEFVVQDSDNVQVLGVSSDGDITLTDTTATEDPWIGLGESAGRIEFDDQTTDEINFLDANVGIGTTSPTNILTIVQNSSTDPIADAWTTYSSRRWKINIKPIEGALNKVKKLRGVYFNWKESGEHDIGMIAEEVGEVIPEVVDYEENGKDAKSLDYARLVAVLVEAIKEQEQKISALEQTIAEIEEKLK